MFSDGDGFKDLTVTVDKCKEFAGGITRLGQTNIFAALYKECKQLQIQFDSAYENVLPRDFKFILHGITSASLYLDVLESLLTKPVAFLKKEILGSIQSYFNKFESYFIIFFSCFIALVFFTAFIFFYSKFY